MPRTPVFETEADTLLGAPIYLAPTSGAWLCPPLYARAGLDSLGMIAGFVHTVSRRGDVGEGAELRLRLAVEELTANTILHGYGDVGYSRLILLGGGDGRGSVSVQLRDSAAPFDPAAAPVNVRVDLPVKDRPVGGLGIHLALSSADEYRYEYVNGQNRSTLTVWRHADENTWGAQE